MLPNSSDDDLAPLATKAWSGGDANDSNWTSNGNWDGVGGAGPNDNLIFSSFIPGVPGLLDSALTALGGTRTLLIETTGALGARRIFSGSLRGR